MRFLTLPIVLLGNGVAPHIFQFVKFPVLRKHYVYHHVHIVDQYPLGRLEPFMMIGLLVAMDPYLVFYIVGNGSYLGLIGRLTDNKEIGHRLIDLS